MTDPEYLKRISREAGPLLGEDFLKGEREFSEDELNPYIETTSIRLDLTPLDEAIEKIVAGEEYKGETHDKYDNSIDAALAQTVHETIDVTRRQASDPGIWYHLTILRYPDFVRYRWRYNSETAMREKFLAAGSDIYSNALHRLWWAAELTYEEESDDPYERTRRVLGFQELANDIFDRWFARYRQAAVVVADALSDAPAAVVSDTTTELRQRLTVYRLEALTEDEIREMVEELREEVERERAKSDE